MHREGMNGDQNPNGASSVAPSKSFAPLSTSRASPFPATAPSTKNAMAAATYMSSAQGYRPSVTTQQSYSLPPPVTPIGQFDRDANANATKPVGTPFSSTPPPPLLIRNLPLSTTEENLRFLLSACSDEVGEVEVLPAEQSEDPGFRSALVKFSTLAVAQSVQRSLDGKLNTTKDAKYIVEIMGSSPTSLGKGLPIDTNVPGVTSAASSSAGSTASATMRQATRYNAAFQSLDGIQNGIYSGTELTSPDTASHSFHTIFSPQSPIGNHITERTRMSGKTLINNDAADDDETGELLKDPVGFAESGMQRRQTVPQIPTARMGSLSLNTTPTPTGPSPMSQYGHPGLGGLASHHGPSTMSPTAVMGVPGPGLGYNHPPPYRSHNFPPANPADQNPPCNTLYVGNLPIDTSEEELKAMFSKQRGYKRLCFRTKQNGPMCFVEFEDVSFATKALHDLYGHPLHNSVKGGIRLSFSKNPLGVRSGQTPGQNAGGSAAGMNGLHPGSSTAFTTANGPPPGLTAPPGLSQNRTGYSASPGLGNGSTSQYASPAFSNAPNSPWGPYIGHPSAMTTAAHNYPAHMMGR